MQGHKLLDHGLIWFLPVSELTACGGEPAAPQPQLTPLVISLQITKADCPSVEVQAGIQISWTNVDSVDHALWIERTDEQGVVIDSGSTDLLQPDAEFSTNLTEPGQYTYYCLKDRGEIGTITVLP